MVSKRLEDRVDQPETDCNQLGLTLLRIKSVLLAVSYKAEERIAYVLIEKSERRAATGARNNPNQNTGEDSNICDIPVILAPNGKLGQN